MHICGGFLVDASSCSFMHLLNLALNFLRGLSMFTSLLEMKFTKRSESSENINFAQ